ncbi:MAG: hypothetical protein NVS4B6_11090 [Mycobacterium sp.]
MAHARTSPAPIGEVGCAADRARALGAARTSSPPFSWDELTKLLAREFSRVVDAQGNEAIYRGSCGWAGAGRFHHAQSHRFLKSLGVYTFSRHNRNVLTDDAGTVLDAGLYGCAGAGAGREVRRDPVAAEGA